MTAILRSVCKGILVPLLVLTWCSAVLAQSTMSGRVVQAGDRDGLADPGEAPMPGTPVLYIWAGPDDLFDTGDESEVTVWTDLAGAYLVATNIPGNHRLVVLPPTGAACADADGGVLGSIDLVVTPGPDRTFTGLDFEICLSDPTCDGVDDDGDGLIDEDVPAGPPCDGPDPDGCMDGVLVCDPELGDFLCDEPGPGRVEECNGADDDCNGLVDDGPLCPDDMLCVAGACRVPECLVDGDCPDGDACRPWVCDPETWSCVPRWTDCNDLDPCTADWCDPVDGCLHDRDPGCGECVEAGDCEPVPCAEAACPEGLCAYQALPDGLACDDANACTSNESCMAGLCVGTPKTCDDGDPCTTDGCYTLTGACYFHPIPGCGPCTVDDDCDDLNPCTRNTCGLSGQCEYPAWLDGVERPCDDGDPCTGGDRCMDVWCMPGEPLECDDLDPCTADWCEPEAGGCVHQYVCPPCIDDEGCPFFGPCLAGTCEAEQCVYVPLPEGTVCDDGTPCTVGDACHSGACGGAPLCNDDDPCTQDGCTGAGECVFVPMDCDDGDPCTQDTCDPVLGCRNEWIPDCHCIPDCAGRECGPDGCGGLCGECAPDQLCDGAGQCIASAVCGNGVPEAGEECDDGNLLPGDGCGPDCRLEECVGDLSAAGEFNVFVFGDCTGFLDIGGRLAAGGRVSATGFSVALAHPGGAALVAGGDATLTSGTIHGDAWAGGALSLTWVDVKGTRHDHALPLSFSEAQATLEALSDRLASLAPTGAATDIGTLDAPQLRLAGSDPVLNVFEVSGATLSGLKALQIQVPAGATTVVNVTGATWAVHDFAFFGADAGRVLFNARDATSIHAWGIGFQGSLLAPRATVFFENGAWDGQVVAAAMSGNGEVHWVPFLGNVPCEPAPASPVSVMACSSGRAGPDGSPVLLVLMVAWLIVRRRSASLRAGA